jgi:hypothetical protein
MNKILTVCIIALFLSVSVAFADSLQPPSDVGGTVAVSKALKANTKAKTQLNHPKSIKEESTKAEKQQPTVVKKLIENGSITVAAPQGAH